MPHERITSRLAEHREKAGLTQQDLARLLDVSDNTIANWENNRGGIDKFAYVITLCKVLDCLPEDLIKREPYILGSSSSRRQLRLEQKQLKLDELHKRMKTNDSKDVSAPSVNEQEL
jgi:transcriptional regulator with XRE-family HTH domain